MIQKSETPLAGGTANGADFKAVEASVLNYRKPSILTTLSHRCSEHIVGDVSAFDAAPTTAATIHTAGASS